jgi:hypothetical protein
MKISRRFFYALLSLPLLQAAETDTLRYVGASNHDAARWRSDEIKKTLDADGNHIYGSAGFVLPGAGRDAGYRADKTDWFQHASSQVKLPEGWKGEVSEDLRDSAHIDFGLSFGGPRIDHPEAKESIFSGYAFAWIWEDETPLLTLLPPAPANARPVRIGILLPNDNINTLALVGGDQKAEVEIPEGAGLTWYFFDVKPNTPVVPLHFTVGRRYQTNGKDPSFLAISFDWLPAPQP